MRVLALDLSLTSTGVATPDGGTFTVTTDAAQPLELRLWRIVTEAIHTPLTLGGADLAVIEDLPRNAKGAGATGPVHGAVAVSLLLESVPIVRVPAATVKKYATGVGNCDKGAMGIAAQKRAGLDFSGRGDECDAWWLRAAALDHYGTPVVSVPAAQREALGKVAWPEVAEQVA